MGVVKSSIRLLITSLIFSFIIYIYSNFRVTYPCLACEDSGTFVKCAPGTGVGARGCANYKTATQRLEAAKRSIKALQGSLAEAARLADIPIEEIKNLMIKVNSLKLSIVSQIPPLEPFRIPPISSWSCPIDNSVFGIKPEGFNANEKADALFRAHLSMVKEEVVKHEKYVNRVIKGVNYSQEKISQMAGLPPQPKIGKANFTERATSPQVDYCKGFGDQLNEKINNFNRNMDTMEKGINQATYYINVGMNKSVAAMQFGLSEILIGLKNTFGSLKILADIFPKISDLFLKLGGISVVDFLSLTVLPFIQSIFPGAAILDLIFWFLFILFISFVLISVQVLKLILQPFSDVATIFYGLLSGK